MNTKCKNLLKTGRTYVCSMCANDGKWLGKNLTLHVDHIDGDNKNNSQSNLRFLCPNCHTQTDTYCGRNKSKYYPWKEISDDQYKLAIVKTTNANGTLKYLNLNNRNMLAVQHVLKIKNQFGLNFLLKDKKPNHKAFNLNRKELIEFDRQENIKIISNSNIKFNEFGWVQEVSKILLIAPQKVGLWMNKNMHEFYLNKCYRRKLSTRNYADVAQSAEAMDLKSIQYGFESRDPHQKIMGE